MKPPKPLTMQFMDTIIEPEWNQDLFKWTYPIPLCWYGKDVRDCDDKYFRSIFTREYQTRFNRHINVEFHREADPDETGIVGYICCD